MEASNPLPFRIHDSRATESQERLDKLQPKAAGIIVIAPTPFCDARRIAPTADEIFVDAMKASREASGC